MTTILGIDPGTRDYGVALVTLPDTLTFAQHCHDASRAPLLTRIRCIKRNLLQVVHAWQPAQIIIEDFTHQGERVKTWRELPLMLGALLDLEDLTCIPVELATAGLWKSELIGAKFLRIWTSQGWNAKDKVRWALEQRCGVEAVRDIFGGLTKAQASHAQDAAGLALWGADRWGLAQHMTKVMTT